MTYRIVTNNFVNSNYNRILCTDGEYHANIHVGINGYKQKEWKTKAGAERALNGLNRKDVEIQEIK